jgi:uncharacterized protein (DUF1697 family)
MMSVFVVLLRAIGPITHKIMSMAQWREAVAKAGFVEPETYVATGNMIVESALGIADVTRRMNEIVLELGLGPNNTAIVRTARQMQRLLAANPLPEAADANPQALAVYFFAKARPDFGWIDDYAGTETIHIEGTHLVVDYVTPVSSSRLPAIIEKKSGTVTARNWNTLKGLATRAAAREHRED